MADNGIPVVEPREPEIRRQHISGILRRPKRAETAYTMFLKDFFHQHDVGDNATMEAMREADVQWGKLNPGQRRQFENMHTVDKSRYKREMVLWRKQQKFIKRPPTSYALYLKDFWAMERNSRRSIIEHRRLVSKRWKTMTQEMKSVYRGRHVTLVAQHKKNIAQLIFGNVIATNEGTIQIAPRVYVYDDDSSDDEDRSNDEDSSDDEDRSNDEDSSDDEDSSEDE